ncbi:N-glycosylation protein-domain-containing protein [Mycena rosella]|uniref:N-glycosylation protein-domain-containing protein n=1 Tax=Mycena rosella TaxID=1033263 RepID=A0AAD7GI16_MYCRO|nr:N-glycosylation protein-domain-containing protein [Mycena rosella]
MPPPDSDDDGDEDDVIYTARRTPTFRTRLFGGRGKADTISTAHGRRGAGETETELDEPPRHLPTSRIIPASAPLVPPSTLQQRLTPLLFEFSRLLAVVPAIFGTLYNLYLVSHPPSGPRAPERIDFFVSALWAILTGYQCLALTTGLLARWRLYYPPLPTLIRLLALQAICWPATHLSLTLLNHTRRPAAVWAAIGTTTCMSRSVQIWVTSNLWWEHAPPPQGAPAGWRRFGGRWGGRRWDWREVGLQCLLPAGVLYFVMAWAEQLRREWSDC